MAIPFRLSYAGLPFLLPTQEVEDIIEARIPLSQLREYNPPIREWPGKNLAGIAFANPPDEPAIRLNQFFYPTGAARWSVFHGIVDSFTVSEMQSLAIPDGGIGLSPQDFIVSTGQALQGANVLNTDGIIGTSVSTELFLLPPRPISPRGDGSEFSSPDEIQKLWLVTLVDERYYWQWYDGGQITCTGDTGTWAGLINVLAGILGITITYETIPLVYGSPAIDSAFYSNYENAALLLDAAAYNIGCVVVRQFDGSYKLVEFAKALSNMTRTRPTDPVTVAGGEILFGIDPAGSNLAVADSTRRAILPASVVVTFPKVGPDGAYIDPSKRAWILNSYGSVYVKTVSLASLLIVPATDGSFVGTQTIHDTARAFMPDTTGFGIPVNQANLDGLAQQIAQDYYYSVLASLDEVYPGIHPWTPDGAADITWTYRNDSPTTRVQRKPYNWQVPEMQHDLSVAPPTSSSDCGDCLCVVKDGNGNVIDIQRTDSNGNKFIVPECLNPPQLCCWDSICPLSPAAWAITFPPCTTPPPPDPLPCPQCPPGQVLFNGVCTGGALDCPPGLIFSRDPSGCGYSCQPPGIGGFLGQVGGVLPPNVIPPNNPINPEPEPIGCHCFLFCGQTFFLKPDGLCDYVFGGVNCLDALGGAVAEMVLRCGVVGNLITFGIYERFPDGSSCRIIWSISQSAWNCLGPNSLGFNAGLSVSDDAHGNVIGPCGCFANPFPLAVTLTAVT